MVQRLGIQVQKSTRNYLIIVGLVSEDGSMDGNDLRDYAQSNLEKVLSRIPGRRRSGYLRHPILDAGLAQPR